MPFFRSILVFALRVLACLMLCPCGRASKLNLQSHGTGRMLMANTTLQRYQKPYNVCTSDWSPMVRIMCKKSFIVVHTPDSSSGVVHMLQPAPHESSYLVQHNAFHCCSCCNSFCANSSATQSLNGVQHDF